MKILRYILTIAVIASMFGCENLDEQPKSILSPESFYNTEADLRAAITACYSPLMGNWNGISVRSWALHMGADDMTSRRGANKQRLLEFDDFNISTNNIDNRNMWNTYYQGISACNLAIANYEKVKMNEELKQQLIAQAFFIRAFCYYNAVRFWGDIPLITEPVEDDGLSIVRSPAADVYTQILADLEFAEQKLPVNWPGQPGAATKGAAKTMLADVYLTMAGWPMKQIDKYALAAQKAKEVMNLGAYDLMPNFKDLFNLATKNNQEHIWNLQASVNDKYPSKLGISFLPPDEKGWCDYVAEVDFFERFPENRRKDQTYYTEFTVNGETVNWQDGMLGLPFFSKYWDDANPKDKKKVNGDHLFPIYRYAEVLLIYAEAQNRANGGPDQSCYDAVNAIRARANAGVADDAPAGLSEAEFDQLVFDEKGWEFAAEQKRWHDLVRKELVAEYNKDKATITTTITKDNYIFPIPAYEREINPGLTQNPGY
ncbi:RagB/SusD family nutrient uptake outer membrane protein [Puteibacter caeruleilacunae]|nr:RagB/SusD family nutrient uptake outer membrane protein [Puteibacter caeruleilacunae]